ncbi:hypothetical protein BOX15_Mlig005966g1 [Macrostomum lignano]|uniref:Uncharacterized protein n=1 Tax=Macrostomum lignano TaxID=282301 RepID=A0A267EKP2_9PLAT|nr:hypothetical protein BOX15_Mlig005966g2 [Macrostomum lignano]PAA61554.1 hypothetical protein BOX15_Mlig005966g1 [Macrostomum lignano]
MPSAARDMPGITLSNNSSNGLNTASRSKQAASQDHQQQQLTNSELYEIRQRQQRDKREEVTWETSSYDRDRGRMVRSLNIVERNRLVERQRQLDKEMEQRMRDIRLAQSAVASQQTASLNGRSRRRAASQQDLAAAGSSDASYRSHSGSCAAALGTR